MKDIREVGILGAGTMGSGIAQVFAHKGYDVVVFDIQDESLERSKGFIGRFNKSFIKREQMTEAESEEMIENIKFTSALEDLANCDLIVEAIVEILNVKKDVFSNLDRICKGETIFATNTSSLSITEIASATNRPDQFIGMHFFNPVPRMELVEVINAITTSEETKEAIMETSRKLGKTPVEVEEAPGFIVNRVLIPFTNEGIEILSAGLASAEDIDTAIKFGANHPMGPLELGDLIGLDVCLNIMEVLYNGFDDEKYRPHPLLRKMVAANRLGRKTGRGFYEYNK